MATEIINGISSQTVINNSTSNLESGVSVGSGTSTAKPQTILYFNIPNTGTSYTISSVVLKFKAKASNTNAKPLCAASLGGVASTGSYNYVFYSASYPYGTSGADNNTNFDYNDATTAITTTSWQEYSISLNIPSN